MNDTTVIDSTMEKIVSNRKNFIKKTYLHTAFAILSFAIVESLIIISGLGNKIFSLISGSGSWVWLVVLGAFMGVSILANNMAQSETSKSMQYAGLGLYVLIEALIFAPMILIAATIAPTVLLTAFGLTMFLFAGLTLLAFKGGMDWSFLGKFLMIGGFVALGIIILSIILGSSLGLWFSGAMIIFASASILYETSEIQHRFNENQYVAASLALFSSVALLFWYILQFLLSLVSDD